MIREIFQADPADEARQRLDEVTRRVHRPVPKVALRGPDQMAL